MDDWTTEWLQTVNEQFYLMEEYQGQAEVFQGTGRVSWDNLLTNWKAFISEKDTCQTDDKPKFFETPSDDLIPYFNQIFSELKKVWEVIPDDKLREDWIASSLGAILEHKKMWLRVQNREDSFTGIDELADENSAWKGYPTDTLNKE